jgi:hypothetical protein
MPTSPDPGILLTLSVASVTVVPHGVSVMRRPYPRVPWAWNDIPRSLVLRPVARAAEQALPPGRDLHQPLPKAMV